LINWRRSVSACVSAALATALSGSRSREQSSVNADAVTAQAAQWSSRVPSGSASAARIAVANASISGAIGSPARSILLAHTISSSQRGSPFFRWCRPLRPGIAYQAKHSLGDQDDE
jgi:hypothetical protein